MSKNILFILFMYLLTTCKEDHQVLYFKYKAENAMYEPIGLVEIPKNWLPNVRCYEFSYNKDGKVIKIRPVEDGKISPLPSDWEGASQIKISYSTNSQIIAYLDEKGSAFQKANGVASRIVELKDGTPQKIYYKDSLDAIVYDQQNNNYQLIIAYRGKLRQAVPSNDSLVYYSLFNNNNLIIEDYLKTKEGKFVENSNSVCKTKFKYNSQSLLIERRYFDCTDNPTISNEGISIATIKYDSYGNIVETATYDTDMNLSPFSNTQVCRVEYTYDDSGRIIKVEKFNKSNEVIE